MEIDFVCAYACNEENPNLLCVSHLRAVEINRSATKCDTKRKLIYMVGWKAITGGSDIGRDRLDHIFYDGPNGSPFQIK